MSGRAAAASRRDLCCPRTSLSGLSPRVAVAMVEVVEMARLSLGAVAVRCGVGLSFVSTTAVREAGLLGANKMRPVLCQLADTHF